MTKLNLILRPLLTTLVAAGAAYGAPNCGATIVLNPNVPYNLTGNVGPCPVDGLRLRGPGTLNLNGFSILGMSGSAGSTGFGLDFGGDFSSGGSITVNGPGRVANFTVGAFLPHNTSAVVIQNVTFTNNRSGIEASDSRDLHFRGNTIEGGGNAEKGIWVLSCGSVKIKENRITGQATVGLSILSESIGITATLNTIESNLDGVIVESTPPIPLEVLLLGNSVTKNYRDGIRVSGGLDPVAAVEGNDVSYNVRDGLVLVGSPSSAFRAEDNRAYMNGHYGISTSYGWRVLENWLSRNGSKDLFWDSTKPGACFSFNQYKTSMPAILPGCTP